MNHEHLAVQFSQRYSVAKAANNSYVNGYTTNSIHTNAVSIIMYKSKLYGDRGPISNRGNNAVTGEVCGIEEDSLSASASGSIM